MKGKNKCFSLESTENSLGKAVAVYLALPQPKWQTFSPHRWPVRIFLLSLCKCLVRGWWSMWFSCNVMLPSLEWQESILWSLPGNLSCLIPPPLQRGPCSLAFCRICPHSQQSVKVACRTQDASCFYPIYVLVFGEAGFMWHGVRGEHRIIPRWWSRAGRVWEAWRILLQRDAEVEVFLVGG